MLCQLCVAILLFSFTLEIFYYSTLQAINQRCYWVLLSLFQKLVDIFQHCELNLSASIHSLDQSDISRYCRTVGNDKPIKQEIKPTEKCSRTFLIFSDDKTAKDYFNIPKRRPPTRLICPITRQKARYIDPITRTPFATTRAFRCLREALRQQLATKSDGSTVVIEQKSTRSPGSTQVK